MFGRHKGRLLWGWVFLAGLQMSTQTVRDLFHEDCWINTNCRTQLQFTQAIFPFWGELSFWCASAHLNFKSAALPIKHHKFELDFSMLHRGYYRYECIVQCDDLHQIDLQTPFFFTWQYDNNHDLSPCFSNAIGITNQELKLVPIWFKHRNSEK